MLIDLPTIRPIYDVVGWVWPAWVPPLGFLYVAIQQSGTPSRLKCEFSGVVRMQMASFKTNSASMLQYPRVIPADGMVLRPGVFSLADLS